MKGKDNKHTKSFNISHLKEGEKIQSHLEGWIGEMMGKGNKAQHNGQFILTCERACFYRKGLLGEVLETIPIDRITSIETVSVLGYRVLRLHTSNDALEFKTFEDKQLYQETYEKLEGLRNISKLPIKTPINKENTDSILVKIKQLSDLKDKGILTEDEFTTKKTELLSLL